MDIEVNKDSTARVSMPLRRFFSKKIFCIAYDIKIFVFLHRERYK